MKIIKATIENYRSIESLEIDLSSEGDCHARILAGINESGKSNILKALALLSAESQLTYSKDINKKAKSEKKEIKVRYELEDDSIVTFLSHIESKGVPPEVFKKIEIEKIERVVSFDSTSARNDYFFIYLKDMPAITGYSYSTSTKTFSMSVGTPEPDTTPVSDPEPAPVEVTPLTTPEPAKPKDKVIALDTKKAWEETLEDGFANEALESLMPRVIFWAYDDKYLINKEINLTEFSASPATISKPLHNVFNLANYTDTQIPSVITDALEDGAQMGELADKLEKTATSYLEEVWPEHRVGIKVHTANPNISFHIVEKDTPTGGRYEIAERSDGFKHFFAVLLNLAAENSTSQLKDCLILLDEPEVHLHPSGAKFLRDELLRIAKLNTVVYSTHSIFMIDRSCLDRHYKVSKEEETTRILKIDSSNPFKEELIYEALGTSILDLISEHNILFEGLTDKKLFEAFTHKFRGDIKPLDITAMSVDGESHFDKYCKFFNKKNIKGYIVADSDKDGFNAKTRIVRDNTPEYNAKNTFVINDIRETNKKSSLEDLLPKDVLQKCLEEFCGVTTTLDDSKTFADQITVLNTSKTNKIDTNKLKSFISDFVCNDITKSGMTKDKTKGKYPIYHEFIVNLHQKLKDANIT
jgi:predicted ATP-dependent endonuclease of OLD family